MDNALFSKEFTGGRFYWWIGQVCQSKFWRENLTDKPVANRDDIPGFGYRYKVRIMGIHDNPTQQGYDSGILGGPIFAPEPPPTDEELPWCGVINSPWGGGEGASFQTPGIRQGSFVFGFFLDGLNQQNPVILGVLGNHFKYRAKDGVFRTFGASTGYDNITDNQIPDSDIPSKERNFKSESCDAPNLECKATEKQRVSLNTKHHLECVYKPDSAKGGMQVAFSNLSDGIALFQKGISEYPSVLAKGDEKLNELLDKHLGDVTANMNSIMSLAQSFSLSSALQVAATLIRKADPSLKLQLTKAQEKQQKILACMFNAVSRGLGGKIRKAVKDKLFGDSQPIPEGYYLPSNPCFTEAIIADVMAQSIDEITDTMDSSNKNLLEEASGLLSGFSNLSASALLPTGLLSGAISGGLGSLGGGMNLGGAMSFISGLATFFACIKEATCPESDTLKNDGEESSESDKVNLENAADQARDGKIDENTEVDLDTLRKQDFEQVGGKIMTDKKSGKKIYVPKTYDEYNTLKNSGKLNQAIFLSETDLSDIRKENDLASIAVSSGKFEEVIVDGKTLLKSTKKIDQNDNQNSNNNNISPSNTSTTRGFSYASSINVLGTKGLQPLNEKDISDQLKEEQFTQLLIDSGQWQQTEINGETVLQKASESIFNSNLNYGDLTGVDYSKFMDDTTNYFDEALKTDNIPFTFNLPNALDTKISEDDQRWLDSKENLVNIAQILKPLGVPSDFAKYAIQYAKGDDTPITSFSAGTRKAIETIVLRKYKNNPSLFANGKKVQINYGDYGQADSGNKILDTVESLRFPNVRLGLGTFTVSVNDQGLINVTDTFNVQQDFKGTYAFSGVPTLEDSASRIVDIAHKVRGVSPGQEDKGGIPINVTFSSNKLKKEIEKNK